MDLTVTKTILAFVLLGLGIVAAGAMLALMGRLEPPREPGRFRALHRVTGYLFVCVLIALAVLGGMILRVAGDAISVRGVLHWVLGSLLVLLVALKIVLVRAYRKFLKWAPALGVTILVAAFLVAMLSAGFVLLRGQSWSQDGRPAETYRASSDGPTGSTAVGASEAADVALGLRVYEANCAGCHASDSRTELIGPGLGGLFERDLLEATGERVTRQSVRAQILAPAGAMPPFESRLSDEELEGLLGYLETL